MADKRSLRMLRWLFPPVWLVLLWRNPAAGLGRKLAGTLGILLYSLGYAVALIAILMATTGLEIEWRGGFPPVLTFRKTHADYQALEAHRSGQVAGPTNTSRVVALPASPPGHSNYSTNFRGPQRDGQYTEMPIVTNWPAQGLRPLWRQPIGAGYASFVVANGLAFTIEQRRDREAVTAYELATGREVWAHSYAGRFFEGMGDEGPRATPTWHDDRLYALGALGDFICFEAASGKVLWSHSLLKEHKLQNLRYGLSGSPLIVDDTVVVQGGAGAPTLFAYHRTNGTLRWAVMNDKQAYMSPMLVTLAGERQILVVTAKRAVGLRPENGWELWSFPWTVQYDNNIAQPVILGASRFLLSAGYGTGAAAVEIERRGDGLAAKEVWRNRNLKNKFASSVFWEGHIYGLDEDMLTCLDAATGERRWKDGRYGYGQLLLASRHLVILAGNGDLALVRATPERWEELRRFRVLTGKTWNVPALAQGYLLVRNAVEMACFDLRAPQ